jgi:hypothetical protein
VNRKTYLQVPLVIVSVITLIIILAVAWALMLVPVMIRPSIVSGFDPGSKITEYMVRHTIHSAMKGERNATVA